SSSGTSTHAARSATRRSRGGGSRGGASSSTPARTTTSPPTPRARGPPPPAEALGAPHPVAASQFINEAFAALAGLPPELMGLGHAFEIDKGLEDSLLLEIAQAQLVRQLFPRHPIKWMPATKHKSGDVFWSHRVDGLFDLVGVVTGQSIELLGMMTEAIHNPYLIDRFI